MFENIINELVSRVTEEKLSLKDILKILFSNEELKNKYINEIRRSTIIGQITNEILLKAGSKENCKILAIGDIKYFGSLENKWNELVKNALNNIDVVNLPGYDLTSQGSDGLRYRLRDYMGMYYNLENLPINISNNIVPSYGGTDAFVSILDSIKSLYPNKNINFIFPEASFMANIKIAESILGEKSIIKINKPSGNDFFFNLSLLQKASLGIDDINIYYITTVGNPTGQKLLDDKLYEILDYLSGNKNNIVILDNVYVGLLRKSSSTTMFDKIFSNSKILERIIFVESLSKTLGTTGIRIGWSWTINTRKSCIMI